MDYNAEYQQALSDLKRLVRLTRPVPLGFPQTLPSSVGVGSNEEQATLTHPSKVDLVFDALARLKRAIVSFNARAGELVAEIVSDFELPPSQRRHTPMNKPEVDLSLSISSSSHPLSPLTPPLSSASPLTFVEVTPDGSITASDNQGHHHTLSGPTYSTDSMMIQLLHPSLSIIAQSSCSSFLSMIDEALSSSATDTLNCTQALAATLPVGLTVPLVAIVDFMVRSNDYSYY